MYLELDNCTASYIYHMTKERIAKLEHKIWSNENFVDHFGKAIPRFELDNMALRGEKKKLEHLLEALCLAYADSLPVDW